MFKNAAHRRHSLATANNCEKKTGTSPSLVSRSFFVLFSFFRLSH
ncbi:hypothetical protein U471_29160 [Bacillus amyloliquefaciens CC178]|nr:hypothetical protein U471_29160 [Bacillus amyloliquefaciens CC178]